MPRAYRSHEPSPGARGRSFGVAHRDAVGHVIGVYRRLLLETAEIPPSDLVDIGRRVGDVITARWPDLVDELEGIAAGSGERVEELLAINARTELLGGRGAGECSVIGALGRDSVRLAQNWDWHPDLASAWTVWSVRQESGGWFTTLTEAGILAKMGVNHRGLACGLNLLATSLDGGIAGVPMHVLLRVVLDRCETLLEAVALLLQTPVSASSCITLAAVGEDGPALVAVELSPAGAQILSPAADGLLLHTNHFLRPLDRGEDAQPREHPSTVLRLSKLGRSLSDGETAESTLRSHFPRPEGICRHADDQVAWADRRATLASIVIDPAEPSLRVADGPPCEARFEEVALP